MKNPLDESLGFQLIVAARTMKRALENELNHHNITSSQFAVLKLLWKYNSLSFTDLGKVLHFDNSTLTGIISRMVKAKLVRRTRDRNDRRIVNVSLTPKGHELQPILSKLASDINLQAVNNFSEEEKKVIIELAKRVRENFF